MYSKPFPDVLLKVVAVACVSHIKCHTCLVLLDSVWEAELWTV